MNQRRSFSIPSQMSRRTLLRGAAAAISLPLLEAMTPNTMAATPSVATAANAEAPVRLCYLYFPNGVAPGAWNPTKVGANGTLQKLNPWMSPLEKHKSELTIFRNMWTPRGNGHGAGTATWLTGGSFNEQRTRAGVSVDQVAAEKIGKQTMLPSLELSMQGEGFFSGSLPRNTISWDRNHSAMPRETRPRAIFDRMFRVQSEGAASDRSVLDQVLDDARRMKRQLGSQDNRTVEQYLEAIRGVERRLEFAQQKSQLAKNDSQLSKHMVRPGEGVPEEHSEYMRVMFDMMVLAFWADATRVSTFMLDHGQSNRYFNFMDGVTGTWHALSHWRDISGRTEDDDGVHSWSSRAEKRAMYNRVVKWHHEQFAYFLSRLSEIKEDNRSLLDNSLVLYGSSLSDGHEHEAKNLPLILAGKGGGKLKSGRVVRFKRNTSMSRLHLTMLRRAGVQVERFAETTKTLSLE